MAGVSVDAKKVLDALNRRVLKAQRQGVRAVGVVGYTQSYALPVHERVDVNHPTGKAKFLTDPFKAMRGKAAGLLRLYLSQGKTLGQAVLLVCLEIQADSQAQVPVDTGALKGSAFTRMET